MRLDGVFSVVLAQIPVCAFVLGRVRKKRVEASREQRKEKLGSLCRLLW